MAFGVPLDLGVLWVVLGDVPADAPQVAAQEQAGTRDQLS
jgi:hypothetical protein